MRRLVGWGLLVLGVALSQLAIAAFAATEPIPAWLNILGGLGFYGWWAFVGAGIMVLRSKSRQRPPRLPGP